MFHLSQRVAWHDNRWNGTICHSPRHNSFCLSLPTVRANKKETLEDGLKNKSWRDLPFDKLPPCIREASGFMSAFPVKRRLDHPYIESSKETHGHLRPTIVELPEYSFHAVPYWWMLRENQDVIQARFADPLPPDIDTPWDRPNPWVFSGRRQTKLVNAFFSDLVPEKSLVFFYCKEGHPFGEEVNRLIVGVGKVSKIGQLEQYDADPKSNKDAFPIWDRVIQHSIRQDGYEGFLIPYHDYLVLTGDEGRDATLQSWAREIAAAVAPEHTRAFSYFSDHVGWDASLSALASCMHALQRVKQHGVAPGPWERREEWLNAQMAEIWRNRGAFPGLGSALEALGVRLGTALSYDLVTHNLLKSSDDPWPLIDSLLRGDAKPPKPEVHQPSLAAARRTWTELGSERRALIQLLSRFDLQPEQTIRWFDPTKRSQSTEVSVTDKEILANPYVIAELDLGEIAKPAIAVSTIDRGLLPETTIAAQHPVPEPSRVTAQTDPRRVRGILVQILRSAAEAGDALMAEQDVLNRLVQIQLPHPCEIGSDWLTGNQALLAPMVERFPLPQDDARSISVLQLGALKRREDRLRVTLLARAKKDVPSTGEDWLTLLKQTLSSKPHEVALAEQAQALERITTRRLSVLTGRAGTGKTSTLGALLRSKIIQQGGLLLLAPTGKARVRLNRAVGQDVALTVAQFLYRQGAYDGKLQRPRPDISVKVKFAQARTIVIDECSMLTMDDLATILNVLDHAHVQRIILVGDPNQLPPIGVGRPFADLCVTLEAASESKDEETRKFADAIGRLTIEVRTVQTGESSDLLKLASWFTRERQPADADEILSKLERNQPLNDLEYHFWQEPEQLYTTLFDSLRTHFGRANAKDYEWFNEALGVTSGANRTAEKFQILSPVRLEPHGVYTINRLIQKQFRGGLRRDLELGDEKIGLYDKVIQIRNQERQGYVNSTGQNPKDYIANGEIGLATGTNKHYVNVEFADRVGVSYGYRKGDLNENAPALELAYALTVHKTQGSEFDYVYVIIPKKTRLLSRELLYTAFTRAKKRLILLIEGTEILSLFDYSRPDRSETVRRNTNLFTCTVRAVEDEMPFSEYLIHRTERGEPVRSKSELVIANMLHAMGMDYQYEARYVGDDGRVIHPDFRFTDPAGDVVIWEHLGMLSNPDYRQSWERKRAWYEQHGFMMNVNLFITSDDDRGGLDSVEVRRIAELVRTRI